MNTRLTFEISKADDEQRLVFGFAMVSTDVAGNVITDLQNDRIEPAELEKAAYDFVLHSREAGEMHEEGGKGRLVESFVATPEKLAKMGIAVEPAGSAPVAWWVGFKLDEETFKSVKEGKYQMFSIQGTAQRTPVEAHA